MKCGTERTGTMILIVGCGYDPCRCHVEQKCATCGAMFEGLEFLGDPQCGDCFENEVLNQEWGDVSDDGVDGLERWLS